MKKITFSLLAISVAITALANNIQLAGIGLSGQNTTSHFSLIGFDVNWENSWHLSSNENNYDAAWVFAKFRKKGAALWQHATLNYISPGDAASSGNTVATGATMKTSPDGKGIFIYRTADGIGSVNFTGNKLRWNYGVDGVLDSDSIEVNVYAIEMVYVPQGSFYLGSNGDETGHFQRGDKDTTFLLTSEASITVGPAANNLTFVANSYTGSPAGPIPATFPKGYAAFYTMKYECSYQQYVDFLLNLDATRSANRNMGIFTGTYPNITTATPERALDNVSITDMAAYTDWAGLRPMTELEFEKACRGYNISPLINEYSWSSTTITNATPASVVNPGLDNETVSTGNASYAGGGVGRALRTGIFATTLTNRQSSGGTYYGVMEMSGNVMEYVISVGNAAGRSFTGQHGDGNLDLNGNSDQAQLASASAWGTRGGAFNTASTYLRISDRTYANVGVSNGAVNRGGGYGIRCVRTAQ